MGRGRRAVKPSVTIHYCVQCNWMLRATWMAQELLYTFSDDLQQVALQPGSGGVFEISVEGQPIWERVRDGGFPSPKELKRRVRDLLFPGRDLGHVDR
nr:SelT/SelW/SelH family protein [Microbulbifer sediminum]